MTLANGSPEKRSTLENHHVTFDFPPPVRMRTKRALSFSHPETDIHPVPPTYNIKRYSSNMGGADKRLLDRFLSGDSFCSRFRSTSSRNGASSTSRETLATLDSGCGQLDASNRTSVLRDIFDAEYSLVALSLTFFCYVFATRRRLTALLLAPLFVIGTGVLSGCVLAFVLVASVFWRQPDPGRTQYLSVSSSDSHESIDSVGKHSDTHSISNNPTLIYCHQTSKCV